MSFLFIRQSCFAADNIKMKLIDHLERKKINLVLSRLLIFGVVFSILSVCVYFRSLLWSYFQFYFHFRFHHLLEHYKNSRRWREMATPWLIEREREKKSPINYYSWISNEQKKNYNAFISITSATEKSQKNFSAATATAAVAANIVVDATVNANVDAAALRFFIRALLLYPHIAEKSNAFLWIVCNVHMERSLQIGHTCIILI